MLKCMGKKENEFQCKQCKKLPRTVEDEEAEKWHDHTQMKTPCEKFKQLSEEKILE